MADQTEIHRLAQSEDAEERKRAVEELKNNFSILKEKEQAWDDLIRPMQDKNNDVENLHCSVTARYNGAWGEINSRLQSRQNVNLTFTTLVLSAIGLMWSTNNNIESIGLILPSFGLINALWIIHNDTIIGLLSKFCSECEKLDSNDSIPAWHTPEQEWIVEALKYRRLTDWSFIFLLIIIVINSIFKASLIYENNQPKAFFFLFFTIPGFLSIWLVFQNKKKRNDILKNWKFRKGKFSS